MIFDLISFPEIGTEQQQYRKQLQTSEKHQKGEQPFGVMRLEAANAALQEPPRKEYRHARKADGGCQHSGGMPTPIEILAGAWRLSRAQANCLARAFHCTA